jgi:hypothetical protein
MSSWREISTMAGEETEKREGDERRVERRRRDIASGCLLALSFLDKVC